MSWNLFQIVNLYNPISVTGLWGVLNNAGVQGVVAPADWITLQDYYDTINVNMFGLVDVTTTFLPLVKKEKGRIVNTCKSSYTLPKKSFNWYGESLSNDIRCVSFHECESKLQAHAMCCFIGEHTEILYSTCIHIGCTEYAIHSVYMIVFVLTASIAGRVAGITTYAMSKYGVEAYSDCIRSVSLYV